MNRSAVANTNSDSPKAGTADPANKVTDAGRAKRILIVEDEFLIALEPENRLFEVGYDVVWIAATAGGRDGQMRCYEFKKS